MFVGAALAFGPGECARRLPPWVNASYEMDVTFLSEHDLYMSHVGDVVDYARRRRRVDPRSRVRHLVLPNASAVRIEAQEAFLAAARGTAEACPRVI